jgi:hydroxymethylglutaryl-CoA reductase (NADPH)
MKAISRTPSRILSKPPGGYGAVDQARRRRWVERHTGRTLDDLPLPEPEDLEGILENSVGFVPMPMGVAAPLVIEGTYARGEFVVPLCTVEGTLALSMTRGMLAIAMGGGCHTIHLRQELTRSPAFRVGSIAEIPQFLEWVREHFDLVRAAAEGTSRYARLLRIDPHPIQDWVILDFVYDTGNAAGQNMVTLATEAAGRVIREETGLPFVIESGFNSDKKPSHRSLMVGRGHSVIVEFALPDRVMAYLGVTRQAVLEFQALATTTAQAAGLLGNNLHLANALTAIYLATGQDAACAAENALAFSTVVEDGDGLMARMTLPTLTVGTVGGGTRLPAQRRNLELLGCAEGLHSSRKLAEVIAASAAALELSLLAALVSGHFAHAHRRYGRSNGTGEHRR